MINNFVESSIISLPLWVNLSYYLQLYIDRDISYISRVYSNIHALINIVSTFLFLSDIVTIHSYSVLMGITFSYAIFDLRYLILNKDYYLIIHHLLIIISLLPLYNKNELDTYYVRTIAMLFLSEMSTIFLNNSWMMIKDKTTHKKSFKINVYLTLLNFLVFRILNISYIIYDVYYSKFYYWTPAIILLLSININWFRLLILKATTLENKSKIN
jgi:hypothetical protein